MREVNELPYKKLTEKLLADEAILREIRHRMWRLQMAGNAGGVIATLSFAGAAFGNGGPVPLAFFWLLVVFLAGLGCSALTLSSQILETYNASKQRIVEFIEEDPAVIAERVNAARRAGKWTSRMAAILLIAGVVGSVWVLHSLTPA